ncbi:WXG100 family type VII secretion target [Nocardia sp. CNY236]|uniref:WXG100 family type VII secretion target n=1 Tax=Nocardia sp. CNY236 TaxID=1169152 RepID=UPI00041563F1|nr:WXG100 family type VII secretion target [Nocardia sp. CNY236]
MTDSVPTAFVLVPEHVSDAGRYIQQTAQALISGLRSATIDVDGLMTNWRGGAATAYAGAWDEAYRAGLEVFEALADMADLLGVVVDRSVATDSATATGFGSLDLPPT